MPNVPPRSGEAVFSAALQPVKDEALSPLLALDAPFPYDYDLEAPSWVCQLAQTYYFYLVGGGGGGVKPCGCLSGPGAQRDPTQSPTWRSVPTARRTQTLNSVVIIGRRAPPPSS